MTDQGDPWQNQRGDEQTRPVTPPQGEPQYIDPQPQYVEQPTVQAQVPVSAAAPVSVRTHALAAGAVVLAVALVSVIAFFSIHRGGSTAQPPEPSGLPSPAAEPTTSAPSRSSSAGTTTSSSAPADPLAELAEHPLSAGSADMAPSTCDLPRFDPADARQAEFYQAAKVCADNAWNVTLPQAGLPQATVEVVTVTGAPVTTSCGTTVQPTSAPAQCQGTVYMTPAYLRDVEANGRYPGKYLGVFLREYGHALQSVSGVTALYDAAAAQPGADTDGLTTKLNQQATCLAGIATGAMSGLGDVDANITGEIRDRLTRTDAPTGAASWLDKGIQTRQLSSCNTWTG